MTSISKVSKLALTTSLVLVLFYVITIVFLYYYNRNYVCESNLTFWCHDDFQCGSTGPQGIEQYYTGLGIVINPCFSNKSTTGLASCLYGPNATINNTCNISDDDLCPCTIEADNFSGTPNCFSGCPLKLQSGSCPTYHPN